METAEFPIGIGSSFFFQNFFFADTVSKNFRNFHWNLSVPYKFVGIFRGNLLQGKIFLEQNWGAMEIDLHLKFKFS